MISSSERQFITHWIEQKSGPKWRYYVQFTFAWTVVSFLVIFFLSKLFTNAWETGGRNLIFLLIGLSFMAGFLATHFTYAISERRFKKILKREKNLGEN